MNYYRPLVQTGLARPEGAMPLAGGPLWFSHVEVLHRSEPSQVLPAKKVPAEQLERLTSPREHIAGLDLSQPQIMGILNVTPDSFSDGGRHAEPNIALDSALKMEAQGATLIDIGGESTRPGAALVASEEEIKRTAPVIRALRDRSGVAISVDTRKAPVAEAALDAGASLVNDVSGFTFDADLAPLCARTGVPVCVMHAQGDPETMQDDPHYDDVRLDVYDFLEARVNQLVEFGVPRSQIIVDPGIGFGKTLDHNLEILRNLSLFHGLGCAILLGASRKRFVGTIGGEPRADARMPGSIAVALAGVAQGVQFLRVHDVSETAQALRLWQAVR